MQKYIFLKMLANYLICQYYLRCLPATPENRAEIKNNRDFCKDIISQIPDAKYLKQPEDYYNYVISAGISKKIATWFLNKNNLNQLSTAVKNYAETGDLSCFNNWKKTFGQPFLLKIYKLYNSTNLNTKFCDQHYIYFSFSKLN